MAKRTLTNSTQLTEEEEAGLLAACQADPAEFSPLYHHYLGAVYRYIYSRAGNKAETEDLVSQVFLDALEGLPNYQHRGYFAAWLFAITRRKVADHYRKSRPERFEALAETAAAGSDPILEVIARQELACLTEIITRQPETDQELLRLRYAAGLSFKQIAGLLRRSPGAVKMSLYRLLSRLEKQLNQG